MAVPNLKKNIQLTDLKTLLEKLIVGDSVNGSTISGKYLEGVSDSITYTVTLDSSITAEDVQRRNAQPGIEKILINTDLADFLIRFRQHLRDSDNGAEQKKILANQKEILTIIAEKGFLGDEVLNIADFLISGLSKSNNITIEKEKDRLEKTIKILQVLIHFLLGGETSKTHLDEASDKDIPEFTQWAASPIDNWPKLKTDVLEKLQRHDSVSTSFSSTLFSFLNSGEPRTMVPFRKGINLWLQSLFKTEKYKNFEVKKRLIKPDKTELKVESFLLSLEANFNLAQINTDDKTKISKIIDELGPILDALLNNEEPPATPTETTAEKGQEDTGESQELTEETTQRPTQLTPIQAAQQVLQDQDFIVLLREELFTDQYEEYLFTLTPDQVAAINSGSIDLRKTTLYLKEQPTLTDLVVEALQQITVPTGDSQEPIIVEGFIQTVELNLLLGNSTLLARLFELFINQTKTTKAIGIVIGILIDALRDAGELPVTTTEPPKPEDEPEAAQPEPTGKQATTPVATLEEVIARNSQSQNITAEEAKTSLIDKWLSKSRSERAAFLIELGIFPEGFSERRTGAYIDFLIADGLGINPETIDPSFYQSGDVQELRKTYESILWDDFELFLELVNNRTDRSAFNRRLAAKFPKLNKAILQTGYKLNLSQQNSELVEIQRLLKGDTPLTTVDSLNIENTATALQIYFKDPEGYIDRLPIEALLEEFGLRPGRALTPEEALALKAHLKAYLRARGYAALLSKEFKRQIELGLVLTDEYFENEDTEKNGRDNLNNVKKFVKGTHTGKPGSTPQPILIVFAPHETPTDDELDPDDQHVTSLSKEAKEIQKKLIEDYWRAYYAANKELLERQYKRELEIDPDFLRTVPPGMTVGEAAYLANQKSGDSGKATDWRASLAKDLVGTTVDAAIGSAVPGGGVISKLTRTYAQGATDLLRGKVTKEGGVTVALTAAGLYAAKLFVESVMAALNNWGAFFGGVAGLSITGGNPIGFLIGSKIGDFLLPDKLFGVSGPVDLLKLSLGQFGDIFNSFLANLSNFGGTGLAATAAPPATAMFVGTILSLLTGTAFLVSFIYNVPTQSTLSKSGLNRDSGDFCYPVDGIITAIEKYPNGKDHAVYTLSGWGKGSAIDISCAFGAEIVAPFDGELEYHTPTTGILGFTKTKSDDGKTIGPGFYATITAPSGIKAGFLHMVDFGTKTPPRGAGAVQAGEVIGYCNSTGNSTGNHLHYEIWGKPIKEVLPAAPLIGQPVSSKTCKNIGPKNTECFDTSGIADPTKKKKVEDALAQIQGSFPGYVANVCEAQPNIVFSSQEKYPGEGDCSKTRCRYAGSRAGSITIFDALLSDGRGQSAIVYTMVHELAHQIEMGGSPLYSDFTSTVHGTEPSLLDNYRFNPSAREDFAETAAYYADTLLYGTGSPYTKYKQTSPKHFEFASQKLF